MRATKLLENMVLVDLVEVKDKDRRKCFQQLNFIGLLLLLGGGGCDTGGGKILKENVLKIKNLFDCFNFKVVGVMQVETCLIQQMERVELHI